MNKIQKHFLFTQKDYDNLKLIKKRGDCVSDNEAVRMALKIAVGVDAE